MLVGVVVAAPDTFRGSSTSTTRVNSDLDCTYWSEMLAFLRESLQQPAAIRSSPAQVSHSHSTADSPTNLVGLVLHSLQGH